LCRWPGPAGLGLGLPECARRPAAAAPAHARSVRNVGVPCPAPGIAARARGRCGPRRPLPAVDREMLVVGGTRPVLAPSPADGAQRQNQDAPGVCHPRADIGPVDVGGAGGGLHARARLEVGILDRVHVDGQPVGVHRPLRRPHRDGVTAVEPGGVVGGHGPRITAVEDIDRFHPADREPGPVKD
jgi:hypothetical protein